MADDVTLLPCKVCNSKRAVPVRYESRSYGPYWRVSCANCEYDGPARKTKEAAIAAWNACVPNPRIAALEAEVAALQERRCETCIHGEPTVRRGYKTIYCPRHDTYVWDGCDFGCIYWQGEET